MKLSLFVLSIFLMSFSCDTVNPGNNISKIEFQTGGMGGYHEIIKITPDSIQLVYEERRTSKAPLLYSQKIEKAAWDKLLKTLDAINMKDIDSLQSPTMARAYDGAMHSEITITVATGKTFAHSFDDENPAPKLKPLMEGIRALANTVERKN